MTGDALRAARCDAVCAARAVAVVRLPDADAVHRTVDALCDGGVRAIELTLTTPGAVPLLAALRARLGDTVVLGAGSVLSAADARASIEAGATFVVSPVCDAEVIRVAHDAHVPAMAGGYTPNELLHAHRLGADVVKLFPADALGPSYLRAVLAPMPFLRLMPTGGVTPENAGDWLRAGAVAVGLGSAVVDTARIAAGDFAAIRARAEQTIASLAGVPAR
ncbi:MAG: bifunctional 4-hydroxy-2-oxoglutarate aldolase/2-dehydro-3-deoxy-phosphogluconate aldolase [Gemmatimonadaceae bacterium]|jgi:2-dehydro-3-deoxyphosphogluconate aldolase/(4S)-4-hydroxy-2-oxoglutarate aldolase|nr:bifunctional 4-hydroxy-2-oxoglutarate aldolase/2-dehydro-3-deoxy-phosphogluconate aldolase [Gemmatimonadaceae bacterium]